MELEPLDLAHLKYSLFARRRFLPMFLATSLGTFNDNMLRSALVVLIAYSELKGIALPVRPEILVTLCAALLVLPSLLFSSIAGAMADKYEKSRLVVFTKLAEVGIMAAAFYGFARQDIFLLMGLLFISGTHTSFYLPVKFSILPEHMKQGELLAANGFMAAGGYLSILLGMIAGGLLVEMPGNVIGQALLSVSLIGLLAALLIPNSHLSHPETFVRLNIFQGYRELFSHLRVETVVLRAVLCLSWFLAVGSVYMAQFANYAQNVIHANHEVYIFLLTAFSLGIALGSLLCDTLLKGEITAKFLPVAATGISVFTGLMLVNTPSARHEALIDLWLFLATPSFWPMVFCMLMVALCGGLFMVPLYALIQSRSSASHRSRIIAASNFSDSVFMTAMAVVTALMLAVGFGVRDLFIMVAVINLGMVFYARRLCD